MVLLQHDVNRPLCRLAVQGCPELQYDAKQVHALITAGQPLDIAALRVVSGIAGRSLGGVIGSLRVAGRKAFGADMVQLTPWVRHADHTWHRSYSLNPKLVQSG